MSYVLNFPGGFQSSTDKPLDYRAVVDDITALEPVVLATIYVGLIVYDKATGRHYTIKSTDGTQDNLAYSLLTGDTFEHTFVLENVGVQTKTDEVEAASVTVPVDGIYSVASWTENPVPTVSHFPNIYANDKLVTEAEVSGGAVALSRIFPLKAGDIVKSSFQRISTPNYYTLNTWVSTQINGGIVGWCRLDSDRIGVLAKDKRLYTIRTSDWTVIQANDFRASISGDILGSRWLWGGNSGIMTLWCSSGGYYWIQGSTKTITKKAQNTNITSSIKQFVTGNSSNYAYAVFSDGAVRRYLTNSATANSQTFVSVSGMGSGETVKNIYFAMADTFVASSAGKIYSLGFAASTQTAWPVTLIPENTHPLASNNTGTPFTTTGLGECANIQDRCFVMDTGNNIWSVTRAGDWRFETRNVFSNIGPYSASYSDRHFQFGPDKDYIFYCKEANSRTVSIRNGLGTDDDHLRTDVKISTALQLYKRTP